MAIKRVKPKKPEAGKSLADQLPELAREWHHNKNGSLTSYDVSPGSSISVWWKCDKGDDHIWQTSVSNRKAGSKCPFCSGRKVAPSNSLAIRNPELAKEWHPTKNGILTPYNVTPSSQRKAWWKCEKGDDHEWAAVISDRNKGIGCAVCSNYKVVPSNSLATLNPELAAQWHPTKNDKLTPLDVHPGSAKKVWWKCDKGHDHEWQTVVHSRTHGKGCPVCSGRKVVKSTCLSTVNPELAAEWHPTKNENLTPNDVGINSTKKVWWKCDKGDDHEWLTTVNHRSIGLGCPICSNQKIVNSNSLATLNPELAKEWHPIKNGKLTPNNIGPGSGKKVWWQCPKADDHEWSATVTDRNSGKGCPICIGRKVILSNSFGTLFPQILKEWHPTKNGNASPFKYRPGSNKTFWWQCLKHEHHVWKTSINERTSGSKCPHCNPSTSIPELRIYCELKSIFKSTLHRARINGFEVDVYIPELQLGIEYDGSYWHKDKVDLDKRKSKELKSSILLLRMREKGLERISPTDILLEKDKFTFDNIKELLVQIAKLKELDDTQKESINSFLKSNEWKANETFEKLYLEGNHVTFENSIAFLYPELVQQWHSAKNGTLLPEHFGPGSHKKVWWVNYHGKEWQAEICARVGQIKNRRKKGQTNLFKSP